MTHCGSCSYACILKKVLEVTYSYVLNVHCYPKIKAQINKVIIKIKYLVVCLSSSKSKYTFKSPIKHACTAEHI